MESANGGNSSNTQFGVEKLVGTNYKYWRIYPDDKIGEERLRRFLIRGMKKEYNTFVTSIKGCTKQPSVEEFEILLSNKEALAKQMARRLEPDATLFSRDKNKKKNTSFESRNSEKVTGGNFDNSKCYICGKIEHIKKYRRVKLSKANIVSENDGNEKIKWKQCFTIEVTKERNNDVVPVQALYNNDSCKQEWILDSGCSHHTYPIANEGVLKIVVGDTGAVKLNDVFHAPGLKRNIVSVSQITGFGKYILLGPNDVKILDNVKNISVDVVLTSEKKGSLFVMVVGEVYVKKTSQTNSASIWHARLGHLGYQLLWQIYSKKLVDGLPALQNIHGDVVCQDDFSRYTWVKFLKEKSEALSKFAEFKTAVEKDFGKGWRCMDPEPKKLVTSRGIVFDEISSYHSAQKTNNQETILDGDQENFKLLPQRNLQEPNNEGSSNTDDVER
ncbi:hypothetical protein KY285_010907 [Solanum tuberosum]|nr:hypothetical protein KY289_012816 [Solanum tuberosum]KAH0735200.1 hypothetical protein KY285_010907 [Solanum tuberosum]